MCVCVCAHVLFVCVCVLCGVNVCCERVEVCGRSEVCGQGGVDVGSGEWVAIAVCTILSIPTHPARSFV